MTSLIDRAAEGIGEDEAKRTQRVYCPRCGGEGRLLLETYYWDRTTGAPIERSDECPECGGTGGIEVELEPITLEDLEEMNGDA